MISIETIKSEWNKLIERASMAVQELKADLNSKKSLLLYENAHGQLHINQTVLDIEGIKKLMVEAQADDLDIIVHDNKTLIRLVELPLKAKEFLGSIVSGQIESLFPWPRGETFFGYRIQKEDSENLTVSITGVSLQDGHRLIEKLAPVIQGRLRLLAMPADHEKIILHVFKPTLHGQSKYTNQMTRLFLSSFALSLFIVIPTFFLSTFFSNERDLLIAHQNELMLKIGDQATGPELFVRKRKSGEPSITLSIDKIASLLPDHTYLTNFDFNMGRLIASGKSHDANALVSILEGSGHFEQVRFTAPTTRDAAGYDRFQLEARYRIHKGDE